MGMNASHFDLSEKLAEYRNRIELIGNMGYKHDLRKMYESSVWTYRELDKESVTCRRTRKITPAYLEIKADLEAKWENLERYLMWANLM